MNKEGRFYELSEEERAALAGEETGLGDAREAELREDVARLDGYLRGRADADRPKSGPGSNRDLAG